MSRHTIRAEVEVEESVVKLDVEFSYSPGYPATGPSYASGGEPAEGAEVELIRATLVDGDGLAPTDARIARWAESWLSDEGYEKACREAEDDSAPDPDEAYERMRDNAAEKW